MRKVWNVLFLFGFSTLWVILLFLAAFFGATDECQARGYDTAAVSSRGVYCIQSTEFETENPLYQRGDL